MNTQLSRRLIIAACLSTIIALPCIWFNRQCRQSRLNRALIIAVIRSDANEVESLLSAGANPKTRTTNEAHRSFLDALHDLLHPPPPELSETALMKAAANGAPSIVRALIASGADVNAKDKYSDTALMAAAYNGDTMDEYGTTHEIDMIDELGDTPQILAAHRRDAEILKALIAAGAVVNARNLDGFSALILTTDCDNYDCANVLIVSGADVNAKDIHGMSALDWAQATEHKAVAAILQKAGEKQ